MQFDKETQTRILRVASDRQQGRDLEELDARISHVMDLHPEFEEIWTMGEMAAYPQEINGEVVSPFVHTFCIPLWIANFVRVNQNVLKKPSRNFVIRIWKSMKCFTLL